MDKDIIKGRDDSKTLEDEKATIYKQTLGDLRHIADSTRLNIFYITYRLASHTQRPSTDHGNALKRFLRYLKHTKQHGITFKKANGTPIPLTL